MKMLEYHLLNGSSLVISKKVLNTNASKFIAIRIAKTIPKHVFLQQFILDNSLSFNSINSKCFFSVSKSSYSSGAVSSYFVSYTSIYS